MDILIARRIAAFQIEKYGRGAKVEFFRKINVKPNLLLGVNVLTIPHPFHQIGSTSLRRIKEQLTEFGVKGYFSISNGSIYFDDYDEALLVYLKYK